VAKRKKGKGRRRARRAPGGGKRPANQRPKPAAQSNELRRPGELPPGFHVMAKPAGPSCNLRCEYCFYLEKHALYADAPDLRMSDEVLKAYIRKVIAGQDITEIVFAWQGGEPTLLGVDFFRRAIRFQRQYAGGKKITNTFQTNGTLLDDEWCEFLAKHDMLVGLSLDGPPDIHDLHRSDRGGGPTFDKVHDALELLQKHRVEYNVLACVSREAAHRPLDVYHFLKKEGVDFVQFIPIVERTPGARAKQLGLDLGLPPDTKEVQESEAVMPWTVEPDTYGDFLIAIFDEWVRNDVGSFYVMNFEWALTSWLGLASTTCFFERRCGRAVIIEHNGDIYSCDHFVYPEYKLGNVLTDDMVSMIESPGQIEFGALKETTLPQYCLDCDVQFACNGECPKHRFVRTPAGDPGLNYLCPSYRKYFRHIDRYMKVIANLVAEGLPASNVMQAFEGPLVIPGSDVVHDLARPEDQDPT